MAPLSAKTAFAYGCFVLFLVPFCGVGIFMTIKGLLAAAVDDWVRPASHSSSGL